MTGNLLILMSDEHARHVAGCYGHPIVQTPNLDGLAARGVRFSNAYTPSPICVPARAALATGLPVHRTGHWDNAHPYAGHPPSWGHKLQAAGRQVVSIGKLHYRSERDPTGFDQQHIPMHVAGGIGDVTGSIRDELPVRRKSRDLADNLGPGETNYTRYDRAVRDAAVDWLQTGKKRDSGWTLLVSFVAPHFPLITPQAFYDLYADANLQPRYPGSGPVVSHPWLRALRNCYVYDNFDDRRTQEALRSYYGLVSFLDDNIGQVLSALKDSGLRETTTVVYLSDHGDNLGHNGMWGKSTFFESSAGVPLIMSRPTDSKPRVQHTPASLLDIYPTVLDVAGLDPEAPWKGSASLLEIADQVDSLERPIFSEYHAGGSMSGAFMLRVGRYKLIHYVRHRPQLFDLQSDPFEQTDLTDCADAAPVLAQLEALLGELVDVEAIDCQAKRDQAQLVAEHGGREHLLGGEGFGVTPPPEVGGVNP